MTTKFHSDIDIDLANRDALLELIDHTAAAIGTNSGARKHATGVYITDIPYDSSRNFASMDYDEAEKRGYVKLDLLNVNLYNEIKSEEHLIEMMREPDWSVLSDRKTVEQIIHINKHYDTMCKMPEPVDSIPRMAMMIAVIRPGKRHLIGKTWSEVAQTIWLPSEEGFVFKKAHAIAYGHLVVVSMNLHANKLKAAASSQ
jgi:DNA polymerase III alpha subunit